MANYQNGQSYNTSHNRPSHAHDNDQTTYGSQPSYPYQSVHRTPSFNAGDDSRHFDQDGGQGQMGAGYQTYGSPNRDPYGGTVTSINTQPSLPYRTNSQNAPLSGYQYQYQPPTPSHSTYNPAQYQQSQQQHYNTPQVYAPQQSSFPPNSYQPYIPAAYQDTTVPRRNSIYNNQNYYDPHAQYGYTHAQAPYPPPRANETYASQQPGYSGYQHDTSQQYAVHQAVTGYPASQQQTHSPPAPAPPPHDSYGPARPYSQPPNMQPDPYSHGTPQASGYTHLPLSPQISPEVHRNSSFASRISNQSSSFTTSPQPVVPTPPSRHPSDRSPQRSNTVDRHPQGRSLPGVPSESESDNDYFSPHDARHRNVHRHANSSYDDLMQHLDAAISHGSTDTRTDIQYHDARETHPRALSRSTPQPLLTPDEAPTHLNGNIASTGEAYINYGAFSDDSDAEAAAGLAAMQALDEQERAEDARRRSGSATLFPSQTRQSDVGPRPTSSQEVSSDSDYTGYDLGAAGGGYAGDLHYGGGISTHPAAGIAPQREYFDRQNPRMDSVRSSAVSSEGRESQASGIDSNQPPDHHHAHPPIRDLARVDTGGTGGLTEPSPHPRRLSYEDGDESTMFDWDAGRTTSGEGSPSKEGIPDLFFHPGMSQQRPLPPPPSNSDPGSRMPHLIPAGTYTQQSRFSQYTDNRTGHYPSGPDAYSANLLGPSPVPRSSSLSSQREQTRVEHPVRSKTDSDRQKLLKQQVQGRPVSDIYNSSDSPNAAPLDLPTIPRKKFNPSKLSNDQLKKCTEPWALSAIVAWIRDLAEEETDLRESTVVEGIVALFTHKVPTMNTTEAETLGERVVKEMLQANALIREEEWVKFGPGTLSGVLFQLTGTGCYSSKLHTYETRGRCYSYHCMRTLKVVDPNSLSSETKSEDWATYYKLKKEDVEGRDRKEVERQNVLHEVVTGEETYIGQLDVVRTLYRDQLSAAQPPIIPTKKLPGFVRDVFGLVDKVKKVNQDYLLGQLKYRQNEQGPWIVGFSDIFREWIRRARAVYVEYATNYPRADFLVRREAERNLSFRNFLDQVREDRRSNRLSWDSYLKAPITRLQRYSLLLSTVHKNMPKDSEEKTNLAYALDEIRAATFDCNAKLAEMEKKIHLLEYTSKLRLRPQMEKEVELNLDHLGREIIMKGDLLRAGGKGFQWVETHAILFDHYLVLAKPPTRGARQEYYDVSKVPIPMDLIILESSNDQPVVKGSKVGTVTTSVVARGPMSSDPRLVRTTSSIPGGPGTLTHTNTNNSIGSSLSGTTLVPSTTLDAGAKDEKIMYPFRVKHLGKTEIYTLYAPSAQNRQDWCESIITAKTRHAEQLFQQNSEPFKLRVLADTAFGYDGITYPARRIAIKGTPLDRAIKEAEKKYEGQGRPAPVCRAQVNCATVFNQPYGRLMCAIGTDYGVYITEYQNSRGWIRAIHMSRVSQIAVLEEFNLFLLISDKSLIAYHLDVVCPPSATAAQNDSSSRKVPQRLSGSKDVGFFVTGKMKERALVIYKKRDGITSTFKVLEPVLQKSNTSRSRFMPSATRRGQTEFFREYDEFYIPAECYSLNLFQSSLAISTARGVEVLTLDKKQTWSVPNLRSESSETQAHLSSIASRIKDLKPLGMFRLGEAEFLVTFEECAVYVNKHGDVSRGVVMEFVGRAKSACLHGQFLILFDDDFVEIRDAQNGRLKQVIAGRDVRMLDDGGGGTGGPQTPGGATATLGGGMNGLGLQNYGGAPRTVKVCMQHPEYEKSHVVVELIQVMDER